MPHEQKARASAAVTPGLSAAHHLKLGGCLAPDGSLICEKPVLHPCGVDLGLTSESRFSLNRLFYFELLLDE